ncbi:chaperone modulator CbpM [Flavobacterium selenitireducens]|uniref:chaperone modulator CbpM n=1 Tax=Flavobacterium selenitireducens TaxID=2722704 RepID=UPI00168BEEA0|nr:chaperone modulator CbpM [Flavobacterium selenitireducens]MBD3581019.1 hypothetical protein [Flavobacterium selenitireducens]
MITIDEYCRLHNATLDFILSLEQNGLIVLETRDSLRFIPENSLSDLERFRNYHYELHINIEGIDVIENLLQRQRQLQQQLRDLEETLKLYES